MLIEKEIELSELEFDVLIEAYLQAHGNGIPFKWIDWQKKFKTEKELVIYCLENDKEWFEVVKPVEEGVEIDYKKGSDLNG